MNSKLFLKRKASEVNQLDRNALVGYVAWVKDAHIYIYISAEDGGRSNRGTN